MLQRIRRILFRTCAALLSVFILAEVNYPRLSPQAQLAIFAMLGLVLVFLKYPIHRKFEEHIVFQALDFVFALAVVICFGYILVQTEPLFKRFWVDGQQLGDRAGMGTTRDYLIGLLGLLLVLEGTRRAIGLTLCILSLAFLAYAAFGQSMPDWLFPHRGYSWERIVSQTFLHSQGVFGIALKVMFTYVFLFVLFGALLEKTGATGYIINLARRLFRSSVGGPAKVAVVSSGAMGSLSGSAVANTATTGTFTIPMMRSSGFRPTIAGGIEAAASSGGALVPPIMGAGALHDARNCRASSNLSADHQSRPDSCNSLLYHPPFDCPLLCQARRRISRSSRRKRDRNTPVEDRNRGIGLFSGVYYTDSLSAAWLYAISSGQPQLASHPDLDRYSWNLEYYHTG